MFYNFRQNNSGGSFIFDKEAGISVNVIIEANSAKEANILAENIGLYFYGCSDGTDCSCCGDRWYNAQEYDAKFNPEVYGVVVSENSLKSKRDMNWIKNGPECYIHYKDGRIVPSLI